LKQKCWKHPKRSSRRYPRSDTFPFTLLSFMFSDSTFPIQADPISSKPLFSANLLADLPTADPRSRIHPSPRVPQVPARLCQPIATRWNLSSFPLTTQSSGIRLRSHKRTGETTTTVEMVSSSSFSHMYSLPHPPLVPADLVLTQSSLVFSLLSR
jgi:hypothetical protein